MRKRKALFAALMYVILSGGMWMFLCSYTNSYNRLTEEKIVPALLTVNGDSAELTVIGRRCTIDLSTFSEDSRLYFCAYLLCPAELRAELAMLCNTNIQ